MDYYKILGLTKNASENEIKKSYRDLSKKYHPDKNNGNDEKFKEITEAYETLSDKQKKMNYDTGNKMTIQEQREKDIMMIVNIPLKDLYKSFNLKRNIERISLCNNCDGTGYQDKVNHSCKGYGGRGKDIRIMQNGFMIQQIITGCGMCGGRGEQGNHAKCIKCKGTKKIKDNHVIDITLNNNSEIIKLYSEGNQNDNGDRSDIIIKIQSLKDDRFTRVGKDLKCKYEITQTESICGINNKFINIDGTKHDIIYNENINNGETLELNIGEYKVYLEISIKRTNISKEKREMIYKILENKEMKTLIEDTCLFVR